MFESVADIDYQKLISTNYVTQYAKYREYEMRFLLYTEYRVQETPDRYYPKLSETITKKYLSNINDESINDVIFRINSTPTDKELYDMDPNFYKFVGHNLVTAKVNLVNILVTNNLNLSVFEVQHSMEKMDTFNEKVKHASESCFLYHGSSPGNWYSIIRNNIQVMSGTKFETTGAAHGAGIYLSDSFQFSSGYCGIRKMGDMLSMGVYQLVGKKEDYFKESNIFVCNQQDNLILRYMIVGNVPIGIPDLKVEKITMLEKLKELSYTHANSEKLDIKDKISKIHNKRLMSTYARLMNDLPEYIDNIELVDDNINLWTVGLKMDDESNLNENIVIDMLKYGVKHITLELEFTGYPFMPPFVRVKHPRFKAISGHVTIGGSICTEILTNGGWTPQNIDTILLTVKSIIFEGNGRLGDDWDLEYSKGEARSAFSRMLSVHGWV